MKILKLLSVLAIITILNACSKENEIVPNENSYLLSIEQAIQSVKDQNIIFDNKPILLKNGSDEFKELNHLEILDDSGVTAIYIINYQEHDTTYFNIISADSRLSVILAFGEGQITKESIKGGLSVWINEQVKVVERIREKNMSLKEVTEEIIVGMVDPWYEDDNPCEGQNWIINVGPLMSTEWGQGCFYNDDLAAGCNLNCGHKLTGCVATAMAQVIRYHQHSSAYQWGNMLNDYRDFAGTPTQQQIGAVAELMLDAGFTVNMSWGCQSSSANTCGQVSGALTGFFNYSSANSCTNYSPSVSTAIINDINNHRPVIFRGEDNRGGHAWVCDGYSRRNICSWDEETHQIYSATYLFFRMNWGWNGDNNGWFGYSTWGGNFNTDQKVIKNIIP